MAKIDRIAIHYERNLRILKVVVMVLMIGASFVAFGQSVKSIDFSIHQHYISTRAMGMGNAFTAVADDHSSLFYNPAALARRKDGHLRMFLRGGGETDTMKLYDDIDKALDKESEDEKIEAITSLIESRYGRHYGYRLPTVGGLWVRPNWGVAVLPADLSVDVNIHRQVGPSLSVNGYLDSTIAFGYGRYVNWLGKKHQLSIGATLKAIHRIHVGESISAPQLIENDNVFNTDLANEGLTFDLDWGALWTPPVPEKGAFSFFRYMKPSVALVIRNVVDYGFKSNLGVISDKSGEPPPLVRRLDLGSKFELPSFWKFTPRLAADMRDAGHPNFSIKKGLHLGAELSWRMYSWWKGHWALGLNQGYWTAGFGARMAWFQLDIATYGEEVGTSSVPKESRKYLLELALDF